MDFQLEEQTPAMIREERRQAIVKEKQEAMRDRARARLRGDAGDLTADMFGEGETPLFNQRRN